MLANKGKELSTYSAFPIWTAPQGIQIVNNRKYFITEKSPLIKVEERTELESHQFASPNEIMDQGNAFH